ncbi:MAG: hypothetical protein KC646_00340 [Candidatus Cloacimonetes bacterium]|nr:hypothetical protein [Candidatus Cloacimonadota bacterium]
MKTPEFKLYDHIVLPVAFPVIFYILHLRFDLYSQNSSNLFFQVIFIFAIIDINKNKLNSFDQKYLIVSLIIFFLGRLSRPYTLSSSIVPTDFLIVMFCMFRSLQLLLQTINISLQKTRGQYNACVMIFLLFPPFLAIIVPPHRGGCGRSHSPKRACFANLKTLTGAIEMYELDMDSKFKINDLQSYDVLVKHKYLQSFRMCPENKDSKTPYKKSGDYSEICCEVHGCISDSVKN